MSKIELKHIDKYYGKNHILKDVNLTIEDGDFMTLLGPSGCGKTTTLRVVSGLEKPQNGTILMNGKEIVNAAEAHFAPPSERELNLVFQSYALWPHMTVRENIAFGLHIKKMNPAEIKLKTREMLSLVGLSGFEARDVTSLSGGQQQRVAIARALVCEPRVLLLDEPLGALDLKLRKDMQIELKRIQQQVGITFIYVTHDQEEAMSLSHRIVVMNKGKFEQIGTPTEIYDKPATRHVASFIGEMNFIDKGDKTIAVRPEDVTVSLDGSGDFTGTVRTIMVLGHYVVVNVQHGENVIKCFVDRDISEKLSVGQSVGMHIGKHTVFDK